MPAVIGSMNSITRDAAHFGMMVRDRGAFNGEQVIPAKWVDATLAIIHKLRSNMES
jgi:CubicO group peptidase (beta-lactamase class C family)